MELSNEKPKNLWKKVVDNYQVKAIININYKCN
jgi:hypothetical protein